MEAATLDTGAGVASSNGHDGGQFWMRPLPTEGEALSSLPNEGAHGTDPYLRVSESAQRNASAPPMRSL